MKSTSLHGFIVAALATLAVAACTSNPAQNDDASLASRAAGQPGVKEHCVRDTGSRIKVKDRECIGPGRSYSREELDSTGAATPAEALKKLDPSL